jgi:hypothetical protein
MNISVFWDQQCQNVDLHDHYRAMHIDPCDHINKVEKYDVMQATVHECWGLLPELVQYSLQMSPYIVVTLVVVCVVIDLAWKYQRNCSTCEITMPDHYI